ncbi:MAG TPA: hypothetical protein VMZ03_02175 [Chitinophagaceae bacterium]|nr:hypothetical protein [Chitinophagaceae bacterium]
MKRIFLLCLSFILVQLSENAVEAQQYKLRQSTGMMGMNSESTIYVKGMRKRTETKPMMGMPTAPVVIEQCDLQRYVKLNDKKKLYFLEPFAKEAEEVIDEDTKPTTTSKTNPATAASQKGGAIHMWYNITDTGERKKMNGFTARHIWTTQKMKPSPDACMMKDSMIIKTDGWYIDLPQFNCPIRYAPSATAPRQQQQPDCKDRFITHRSGKGKLGFPLTETRTIIMGNGDAKTSEFSTNLETLEFSTLKLDSMLFEIPPGYALAKSESELEEKVSMEDMINQYKKQANNNDVARDPPVQKIKNGIRIGIYQPNSDGQVQGASLQKYMVDMISTGSIEAVAVETEEEARKNNCDYTLTTDFTKIKSGSKVGGLLKAIKNTDPNAASSFTIEATLTLKSLTDRSSPAPQTVSGKYDGKADDAAKKALDDGSSKVLSVIK